MLITSMGGFFHNTFMYQIIMLYILNILQFCQLQLKKAEKDIKILLVIIKICYNNKSLHIKLACLDENVQKIGAFQYNIKIRNSYTAQLAMQETCSIQCNFYSANFYFHLIMTLFNLEAFFKSISSKILSQALITQIPISYSIFLSHC